ncbi:MAG: AAA family ATPase [Prevotella sp.]|nr:AAA family ATPase [Prevotella sp.]
MEPQDNIKTTEAIIAEAVNQPTEAEKQTAERRTALQAMRIKSDTEVRPEEPTLTVDGVGFFAKDDIHAIKGKQKCGKTTALKVCTAAWMTGSHLRLQTDMESPRVLYLDTEQKATDVKLIITDVMQMTALQSDYIDDHLAVYALRRRDFQLLLDDMKLLVSDMRPDVVIIDGIVEFVASFNDESLAKQLIRELLALSEDSHSAIVCVLHTNKADEDHNMRGHLGTMLAQKAGTVLECKKQGGIINVSCSDARHQEMPDWNIMFADDGRIIDADAEMQQQREQHHAELQQRRQEANEQKLKERTELALTIIRDNGGYISRKELTEKLMERTDLKRTTVSSFISSQLGTVLYETDGTIQSTPEAAIPF